MSPPRTRRRRRLAGAGRLARRRSEAELDPGGVFTDVRLAVERVHEVIALVLQAQSHLVRACLCCGMALARRPRRCRVGGAAGRSLFGRKFDADSRRPTRRRVLPQGRRARRAEFVEDEMAGQRLASLSPR